MEHSIWSFGSVSGQGAQGQIGAEGEMHKGVGGFILAVSFH